MKQAEQGAVSLPLIPLSSDEALWEWDLVTDALYFSEGARKLLRLSSSPPRMDDFLEFVKAEDRQALADLHSKIIRGDYRGVAEYEYTCNDQPVHEHILPMSRNSQGKAVRLIARLSSPRGNRAFMPLSPPQDEISSTGAWFHHVPRDRIWRDTVCSAIMGMENSANSSLDSASCILKVHPSERASLERRYRQLIRGELEGESMADIIHVQDSRGRYLSVLLRASVVQRNDSGEAVLIAGIMAPSAPENHINPFSRDDMLFHALNSMGTGQWNWDAKVDSVWYCPRYLAILGYPAQESESFRERWPLLVHPDDLAKIEQARENIISGPTHGDTFECTYRMKDVNGEWVWIFDRGCVTWRDAAGRAGHMVGSITNITTAQAERDRLEELVRHDSLTGLRSRAFCNLEVEHIEQNHIRPVSVLSVDITGLKMINDSLGHAFGDELLTKASSILRGALRASDFIARTGGDEFLVLLPNCDFTKGEKLLKKVQDAFDSYNKTGGHMPVLAACGLASAPDMGEGIKSVIARADQEMYGSKKESRQKDQAILRGWIKSYTGREAVADDRLAKDDG